jgi:hypothetical protein
MNSLQLWGKDLGKVMEKEIIEKIDELRQSSPDNNFEVLQFILNYLDSDFGNVNTFKLKASIIGSKILKEIIEEINDLNIEKCDYWTVLNHTLAYLSNNFKMMIENTKKDKCSWSDWGDLRRQVDHNYSLI